MQKRRVQKYLWPIPSLGFDIFEPCLVFYALRTLWLETCPEGPVSKALRGLKTLAQRKLLFFLSMEDQVPSLHLVPTGVEEGAKGPEGPLEQLF